MALSTTNNSRNKMLDIQPQVVAAFVMGWVMRPMERFDKHSKCHKFDLGRQNEAYNISNRSPRWYLHWHGLCPKLTFVSKFDCFRYFRPIWGFCVVFPYFFCRFLFYFIVVLFWSWLDWTKDSLVQYRVASGLSFKIALSGWAPFCRLCITWGRTKFDTNHYY